MGKVTMQDSVADVLYKISEGNPGALNVLMRIIKEGKRIDPYSAGHILTVAAFDDMRIYGPDIWTLYKDVCGQNLSLMLAVLRAHQFGIITTGLLRKAIGTRGYLLDLNDICVKIKERLPKFCIDTQPPPVATPVATPS